MTNGPQARIMTTTDFLDALEPDGMVAIPTSPGSGVTLNEETVARYRVT